MQNKNSNRIKYNYRKFTKKTTKKQKQNQSNDGQSATQTKSCRVFRLCHSVT